MHIRHVFYVSGFDPRGSRHYRELIKSEMNIWSDKTQKPAELSSSKTGVSLQGDDACTQITFLTWDDILRENWPKDPKPLERKMPQTVWGLARNGTLGKMRRHCKGMFASILTTCLPMARLFLAGFLSFIALIFALTCGTWGVALAAALLALTGSGWIWTKALMARWQVHWTARVTAYTSTLTHTPGPITERADALSEQVLASLDDNTVDEVVVVGHSFGAIMGTLIVAALASKRPEAVSSKRFCFLTMGSILGTLCAHPNAKAAHKALDTIADANIDWLDISSPRDGACCALTNPYALYDSAHPGPKLLNAQFHKTFVPKRLAHGSRYPLEGHFFYMRCPDKVQPDTDLWDWPSTLMDKRTIWQRYAARKPQGTS